MTTVSYILEIQKFLIIVGEGINMINTHYIGPLRERINKTIYYTM